MRWPSCSISLRHAADDACAAAPTPAPSFTDLERLELAQRAPGRRRQDDLVALGLRDRVGRRTHRLCVVSVSSCAGV